MQVEHDNIDEWLQWIIEVAHQRYHAGDIVGMVKLIGKFEALYNHYPDDPERSAIESAAMNCIMMLAESYAAASNFDEALIHCKSVVDLLSENRARFIALGNNPRPNSLVWCELLNTLAEVKWKAPASFEQALFFPQVMVNKYLEVDAQIHNYLSQTPYKEERKNENTFRRTLICGVSMAKLCYRYLPDQIPLVQNYINNTYDLVLNNLERPYAWELKIAQIGCSANPDRKFLLECFDQYERTAINYWGDSQFTDDLLVAIQAERDYLLLNLLTGSTIPTIAMPHLPQTD